MQYELTYNGYTQYYKSNGLNHFSKKVNNKYLIIVCSDIDLTNGNIEYMCKNDISLSKQKQRLHMKRFLKRNNIL